LIEHADFRQRWLPHLLKMAVLVLFLWQGFVSLRRHEPWRDEAQAWLIARDASLATLMELRPFEARPAVWDLMLVPLAKAGLPMFSAQLLHIGLAAGALALVLWNSPFHWTFKLLFAFSYLPFWEYAIVMRIYAACMIWIFALAALYPRRFRYPGLFAGLVCLLFNTSVHAIFIAGVITLLFVVDAFRRGARTPRIVLAVLVMALSGLACLAQVHMPSDHPHIVRRSFHKDFDYTQVMSAMSSTVATAWEPSWPTIICGAAGLGLICVSFLSRWQLLLLTLANLGGLMYIFGRLGSGVRHHGFIVMGVIFCLWIAPCYPVEWPRWLNVRLTHWLVDPRLLRVPLAILGLSFLVSLAPTFQMHKKDRRLDFSGTYRVAEYLRAQRLDHEPIAAFPSAETLAILPYLPQLKFWYPGIQEYGTYVRQDLERTVGEEITVSEAIQRVRNHFSQERFSPEEPLIVLVTPLTEPQDTAACELLLRVDETVFGSDEKMYLYRLRRSGEPRVSIDGPAEAGSQTIP
jgi:hypothetical protein